MTFHATEPVFMRLCICFKKKTSRKPTQCRQGEGDVRVGRPWAASSLSPESAKATLTPITGQSTCW